MEKDVVEMPCGKVTWPDIGLRDDEAGSVASIAMWLEGQRIGTILSAHHKVSLHVPRLKDSLIHSNILQCSCVKVTTCLTTNS